MTVSINKFIYNNTTYVCTGSNYYEAIKVSNRVCKPNQRTNIGHYIQGDKYDEAYYKFMQDVDVAINEVD